MKTDSRNVLLVLPPYADFTYPYHSVSYVAPPLTAAGYRVDVIDLNIVWLRSVFTADWVANRKRELSARLDSYEAESEWTIDRQEEVVGLVQALAICESLRPEDVVEILQSERFYDYDAYLRARAQFRNFERLLTYLYSPFDFYNAFAIPNCEYAHNSQRLVDAAMSVKRFTNDARRLLKSRYGPKEYLLCGVSMPFVVHLCLGLAVLQAVKSLWPKARRVAGGTAVTDVCTCRTSMDALAPLSQVCDDLYVGEAEHGVADYADWCAGRRANPPPQVINLHEATCPARTYVSLSDRDTARLGTAPYDWSADPPDYEWIQWDLYLSPARQVNYAPSRGCFWNKCVFCDYGLNEDAPTAPSRTMNAGLVLDHLEAIVRRGITHVYFAVDSIAPRFLRELAKRLVDRRLAVHWSTELFLTQAFTPELVALLTRSGLVTASFGLESGSSRILTLMGKGKNRGQKVLRPVFDAFRRSTVGLQPKFFFGFPGESDAERQSTVDLLNENRDVFCIVTRGNVFDLAPGSEIAKSPDRFGVTNIRRKPDDNIGGGLDYDHADGTPPPHVASYAEFNRQLNYCHTFERPWAGGIDTFHSKLYLQRYGKTIFHEISHRYAGTDECTRPWSELSLKSRFDIDKVFDNVLIHCAERAQCNRDKMESLLGDELDPVLSECRAPLPCGEVRQTYHLQLR